MEESLLGILIKEIKLIRDAISVEATLDFGMRAILKLKTLLVMENGLRRKGYMKEK
eukprot:CAMPEP_0201281988 /NCGR_PEP_ID=MMETSP1317-20130820/4593_1 /ASSEMBLY_ACC=CAM_ASM_000770 /TAXON_ID=187299 /ORGANISM="Undescribed Undescribed, Strain Undescribed" /LENGTH=55 /DNA_ID=CAMNT_0047593499 /DNA_START=130 /DNA_END=297 /DNA_ORIENTATION=+